MTLLELLSELLGEAWWLSRTAQRLRFWGAVIAIAIFLIALLAGVYDPAPEPDPLCFMPRANCRCRTR